MLSYDAALWQYILYEVWLGDDMYLFNTIIQIESENDIEIIFNEAYYFFSPEYWKTLKNFVCVHNFSV